MANVGLSIQEGVAKGGSAFKSPAKRNIGLLGQFVRGRALTPTKITNLEDFNVIFGGQNAAFYGPGIVRSIFKEADNAPVTLYIARVVGAGSAVATGSVSFNSSRTTMSVRAGYKGNDDPGAWANGIKVTLYSFGSQVRNMFTLTVENGDTREVYNYGTLAEIQKAVNKVSKYVTIEFTGVTTYTTEYNSVGNVTTSDSSNVVTAGTGAHFDSLRPGNVLFYNPTDGVYQQIGTVASVESDTQLTLTTNAFVTVPDDSCAVRNDETFEVSLTGGVDGEVTESDFYPVEGSSPKGLACFKGYDVQLLAHTEFHVLSLEKRFNAFLQEWKSPVGIINLPINSDEGTAELYANELQTNEKSFMAGAYLEWVKVPDDEGNAQLLPSIGSILGAAYIRTPYLSGDFIHIPPGGTDSLLNYVTEVLPERLSQSVINKCVQQFSCNILQYVENVGYYVGSSRTYSTNDLYCSVHIRQQTSYYVRALYQLMRFVEQKPNTPELKREGLVTLHRFFKNEYDNGALERSVDFDTAYQGICDQSNNPVGQDRKLINFDVLWIPTECTESIQLSLQRNDGVLNVTEV